MGKIAYAQPFSLLLPDKKFDHLDSYTQKL